MSVTGDNPGVPFIQGGEVFLAKKAITSAQILTISATPINLIEAQGSGITILPIFRPWAFLQNVVTAYSGTQLLMNFSSGDFDIAELDGGYLATTAGSAPKFTFFEEDPINNTELVANEALRLTAAADPTTGDGDLIIYVPYQLITV